MGKVDKKSQRTAPACGGSGIHYGIHVAVIAVGLLMSILAYNIEWHGWIEKVEKRDVAQNSPAGSNANARAMRQTKPPGDIDTVDVSSGESAGVPLGHMQPLGSHREPSVDIPVIDYVPNSVDFYERFVRRRQPVLMKGAAKPMPAYTRWPRDPHYLRDKFGDSLFKVEMRKSFDNSPYERVVMNLSEFLDRYEKEDIYMDTPAIHSAILDDVTIPMCMACPELKNSIVSSHLLFSSGGTSSSYHFDGSDNLLSLLSGRKRVIFVDVAYHNHSYVNDYVLHQPISPINPDAVDLLKFPRFKDVPYGVIEMEAGDILYNPSLISHHVRSYDSPNIAVNIWFEIFSYDKDVTTRLGLDPSTDLVAFNAALHKTTKEMSPRTIECDVESSRLFSFLKNSSLASDVFTPDEKINGSALEPFRLPTGYLMPRMGFGSPAYIYGEKATAAYLAAFKAGYRMVDCAQLYDEKALGAALRQVNIPRSEIFIISKIHPKNFGTENTLRSIDESLDKLGLEYIDVMLLHARDCRGLPNCHEEGGTWQSAWHGMVRAVELGKVRSLGVSNFDEVAEIQEVLQLARGRLSVIQNYMDPFNVPIEVLNFCSHHNITFMSYGILGRSYVQDDGMPVNPVLTANPVEIASEDRQCMPAQVVLRWAMQLDVAVIPSTVNTVHLAVNLHSFDIHLKPDEMDAITGLRTKPPNPQQKAHTGSVSSQSGEQADSSEVVPAEYQGHVALFSAEANIHELNVFAGGDDGYFIAFNGQSGEILWQYMTFNEFGSTCVFSPDHSHLYFSSENNRVYSVQVSTGEMVWSVHTSHAFIATPRLSTDKSALLTGNLGGQFVSIDRTSGEINWNKKLGNGEIWSTANVAVVDGSEMLFVGMLNSGLYALFVENGSQVWRMDVNAGVWSSPAITADGKQVIFSGQDGRVYCVHSRSGSIIWTWYTRGRLVSSPLLKGNMVFGASDAGAMFALNARTGEKIWKIRISSNTVSSPKLSPDGILVIGGTDRTIRGYDSSTGKRVWTVKTGNEVWASASITSTGVVFIGSTDEYMYALNASDGAVLWKTKVSPFAASPCVSPAYSYSP
ncbi:uncharacterized protein LOC135806366 [Sycon ciliatum]|uniref:uncharacterized protein LOC135806366 n=1 Tax=Sycon ciliatum TaxID=27933 RepID=UPI0031F6733C